MKKHLYIIRPKTKSTSELNITITRLSSIHRVTNFQIRNGEILIENS